VRRGNAAGKKEMEPTQLRRNTTFASLSRKDGHDPKNREEFLRRKGIPFPRGRKVRRGGVTARQRKNRGGRKGKRLKRV